MLTLMEQENGVIDVYCGTSFDYGTPSELDGNTY